MIRRIPRIVPFDARGTCNAEYIASGVAFGAHNGKERSDDLKILYGLTPVSEGLTRIGFSMLHHNRNGVS